MADTNSIRRDCAVCSSPLSGLKKLYCGSACKVAGWKKNNPEQAKAHRSKSENVDPLKVFERDKWRCRLCNVKTPKELRGTYQDNAPELDHIIPLSLGGPHTYANTQCACRKCNGTKSNKPMGQMLLVG